MKKHQFKIAMGLLISSVILIQLFSLLGRKTFTPATFPGSIYAYSDTSSILGENGKSTIHLSPITSKGVQFSYVLDNSFPYYYAGILFEFDSLIDISKWSHMNITLNGGNSGTVRIYILTDEPTIKAMSNGNLWRHLQNLIINSHRLSQYSLPLDQFHTPQWWFGQHGVSKKDVIQNPLTRVRGFKIETGEGEQFGVNGVISIKSIQFYTPLPAIFRYLQIVLSLLAVIALIMQYGFIRRGELGRYTPIVMGSLFDEELVRITDCIGSRYQDPELSLPNIAELCAMHPDKVSALLKRGYGQSYKQYLNRLRLTEAQRLLRTTDRSVVEISLAVGYNSVSHFNKVFKEFFNSTPRDFRG